MHEEVYPVHEDVAIEVDDGILPIPFNVEEYLSHFKRHHKRQTSHQDTGNRYALFILDGSGSIRKENFNTMISFASDMAFVFQHCGFTAVIVYDECTYLSYDFNNFRGHTPETIIELTDCILNTNYPNGLTASGYAIRKAYEDVLNTIQGIVQEIDIIFITDGHSNTGESPCREANDYWEELHEKTENVHVYPIGIGHNVNHTELHCIMGSSAEVDYPMHLLNFEILKNITTNIMVQVSQDTRFCAKFDNYQEMICEYVTA